MGRRGLGAIVATVTAAIALAGFAAAASSSQESDFVSRINAERTSRGLGAVSVSSDLVDVARRWSAKMAASGSISHDPNIGNEISGWTKLGDNVGRGPDVDSIHTAFMNSSEHRSIILDPGYTQVGVGVVASGDTLYVTEIFVRRSTTSVVRHTTARHRVTSRPRTRAVTTVASDVGLTGVVWEVTLGPRPMTVSVLEELNSLDASRVDPTTGDAR
jgi:Cysteine-rich secretory protein family